MRKILASCIVAILLCSALAIIVQAQSTPTTSTASVQSMPITSIAGVNIISSTTIKNASYDNLTVNERMAVGQDAINNYLSGKTKTLVIPGGTIVVPSQTLPSNHSLIPNVPDMPIPVQSNQSPIISRAPLSQVSPLYTTLRLPVYSTGNSSSYSNTYTVFGGKPDPNHDYGPATSSANAQFNYAYPNTLSYLGPFNSEFLVMHLWGSKLSGGATENNIYIMRDSSNQNMIDFWYYDGNLGGIQFLIAQVPQTDKISAYIKALNPIGSSQYSQIQVCIYDATTKIWYRPNGNGNINMPSTQVANSVDMALECVADYNVNLNQWRVAENYIAYNINQGQENLYQYGRVSYYYTPNTTSPVVNNYYYFDPSDYIGVPNGQANIFLTRYAPSCSPPPHP